MLTTRAFTPKSLQLLPRQHTETDLGAGADEDHIRRTAFDVREHIGAARDTGVFRPAPVKMRYRLPRQHEQRWTVMLNRKGPRLRAFVRIGRTDDRKLRNAAQPGKVLDRLMSRAILPEPNAVVRKHVDRFETPKAPRRMAGFGVVSGKR